MAGTASEFVNEPCSSVLVVPRVRLSPPDCPVTVTVELAAKPLPVAVTVPPTLTGFGESISDGRATGRGVGSGGIGVGGRGVSVGVGGAGVSVGAGVAVDVEGAAVASRVACAGFAEVTDVLSPLHAFPRSRRAEKRTAKAHRTLTATRV